MTILAAIVSSFKHEEEKKHELARRCRLRKEKAPMRPEAPKKHIEARGQQNPAYPKRVEIE